jgi:hypothetical protein
MADIRLRSDSGDIYPAFEPLMWIVAAALVGFAVPAIFSSRLHLERGVFLIPYVVLVGSFLTVFFWRRRASPFGPARTWPLGLIGAVIFGFFVVRNVLGQPASTPPEGVQLVWALLWFGVIYGVVDALFLNVMPVLAVRECSSWNGEPAWRRRILVGVLGLVASALVTGAYHLGYSEFRSSTLFAPLLGNMLITLSYLLTRSPLAPVGAHAAMHVASVLHGMETVVQLPPHY